MKENQEKKRSAFQARNTWKNTYPENDFLKILVIGSNKDFAISTTKWLAGNDIDWRGIFKTEHRGKRAAVYFTWPRDLEDLHQNTIGIDVVCAALETDSEWNDLKSEINNFSGVSVRLLLSASSNAKSFANQVNGEFLQRTDNNAKEVLECLDSLDIAQFELLRKMFNKYDNNNSGTIEVKEVSNIAKDLNIDQSNKSFKESILALDTNHDNQLDIEEFLQWYKIGRTHSLSISKIYGLKKYVKNLVSNYLNYDSLLSDRENLDILSKKNLNSVKVLLESDRLGDLVTRLHLKLTIGGPKRGEAAKNFLSKFTSTHSYVGDSWVNFAVFSKSLSIKSERLLTHVKKFQSNLVAWAEKNHLEGLSGFINKFIEFRSFSNESAANVYMKIKLDIESLMKSALEQLLVIRDWLSDENSSFDVNMRIYSSACLGDLINSNKTVADFLNEGEVEITASLLKARLRSLLSNLKQEYSSILGIFQLFFMSSNLNLKFKGPFNEFANEGSFKFFNNSLNFLDPLLKFIKSNFDEDALKCFSRAELTFNLFEVFGNVQLFSETLWSK